MNIIGTDAAHSADLPAAIEKGGIYLGKVGFSGAVRQVKITPKIVLQAEEQICTKKALLIENVKSC